MTGVLAALAGAMIAGGILGIITGLRPAPTQETKRAARPSRHWWSRWVAVPPARRGRPSASRPATSSSR